ncbi:MAG: hypothetical protein ACYC35_21180 [Pirellulales bacterium]
MSTTRPSATATPASADPRPPLGVSRYEKAASMLLALLLLVGISVLLLLMIWLSTQVFAGQTAVPVTLQGIGTGDGPEGEGALREGKELEPPPQNEVVQEQGLVEPEARDTLAVVADAVADKVVALDDPTLTETVTDGTGTGAKGRGMGAKGTGAGGGGRPRQWEVEFIKGHTLDTYARQLDYFRIELGVLLPGNKVVYASNLSQPKPTVRTGAADQEKRYYLTWRGGELIQADQELLARAGISNEGRIILKFIVPELESLLVGLERRQAGAKAELVRRTRFAIRPGGGGYTFVVVDQSFRNP